MALVKDSIVQTAGADRNFAAQFTSRTFLYRVALALIILFNVLGSLYWLRQNTVLLGNDASGYLSDTLDYARFFTPISPESLFQAFTLPVYRTPGLYIAVQPFYWLFGVSMDSAQLVNVVALAGLIWITYGLGRYAVGPGVGLFSALLVGLLPMVFAMARLFYTELPLAALVALNLLALAESDGFRRRRWSLVWGVSLGLGLLVKWALPIYVLLPTLWLFWRAGLLQAWWRTWRSWRVDWRALLIAAGDESGRHSALVSAQSGGHGAVLAGRWPLRRVVPAWTPVGLHAATAGVANEQLVAGAADRSGPCQPLVFAPRGLRDQPGRRRPNPGRRRGHAPFALQLCALLFVLLHLSHRRPGRLGHCAHRPGALALGAGDPPPAPGPQRNALAELALHLPGAGAPGPKQPALPGADPAEHGRTRRRRALALSALAAGDAGRSLDRDPWPAVEHLHLRCVGATLRAYRGALDVTLLFGAAKQLRNRPALSDRAGDSGADRSRKSPRSAADRHAGQHPPIAPRRAQIPDRCRKPPRRSGNPHRNRLARAGWGCSPPSGCW